MGTITVLRPSTTSSGTGWTPSAGTLHGVTSDDSDATYATWAGSGSPMILGTPVDAPPVGEQRHQVRLRARGEDGSAWWAVQLASSALVAAASATFAPSPETVIGSWGFGVPAEGSIVLSAYVSGESAGVRITELYLDVDSREAPDFTAQVRDGSGAVTTTISDTAQPVIRANAVDLDGLNARTYRYWVTLNGAIVWDTGEVSGTAVSRQTSPLDNGSYVAHLQVWSTLGADLAYGSAEQTVAFTVSVGQVARPENPTVTQEPGTPFYEIEVCAPYVEDLDGGTGYMEIQRVDCPVGGYLVATGGAGSYASTPDPTEPPTSTTLYTFEVDDEDWAAETGGATVARSTTYAYASTGSLLAELTPVGGGEQSIRFNDARGTLRDLSVYGSTITAWIYVPVSNGGSGWKAHLELQTPGYGWPGAADIFITPGVWTQLSFTPDPALMVDCRSIGVQVTGFGVTALTAYLDDVTISDPGTGLLPLVDLEVTVHAGRDDDWRPNTDETLASQWDATSPVSGRSWKLFLDADGDGSPEREGRPSLAWSPTGSNTVLTAAADRRAPVDPYGQVHLRALLDVDNGAGGWTVTFSTTDQDGVWVQLGDVVTGAGTTAIFDSGTEYAVGAHTSGTAELFEGRIYSLQVRDGATGEVTANPDFTNHLDSTAEFQDGVGNVWTVHSPARIYSPTSTITVAILGPLETDECASWTDFTLPRSGVGLTCAHNPEPCCSYYRTRTVGREDGELRISNWSDVFDPGIPMGMIVMWPSTAASVPDGWNRVTALDSRYTKGIPNAVTQPGSMGGAATHTHTVPTHTHDTSHSHTVTGATGTATGTATSGDGAAGTLASLSSHTHTRSPVNSTTVVSDTGSPAVGTGSNDPARLEVLFVESDGTPLAVPDGAVALMPDITVSGWDPYAAGTQRFLKGAAPGGDGGATAASGSDAHTHTLGNHTHGGTSHTHTSPSTGFTASNRSLFAGPVANILWQTTHAHPVAVGSTTSGTLASGGSASSGASGTLVPPYRNLRLNQKQLGGIALPVGLICAWRGSIGSIPENWQLCDGTNGTPDMFGRYPRAETGAIGATGGSLTAHDHTSPSHNHTTSGHAHTETVSSSGASVTSTQTAATVTVVTGGHTHSASNTDSTTPTVAGSTSGTLASTTSEPAYEEVAFVQLLSTPEPPPEPDTFCLTWDTDEHLIRAMTPDGPLWAPILGKFEWTVERPFTAASGVSGSRFVTSGAPGGRNLSMVAAVENEADLVLMHAILSRPLVLISPSDANEVWAAPVAESVRIVKVGRIRQITASFIGTGPEPAPQLADVGE